MEIIYFENGDSLVEPKNDVDQEVCCLRMLPDDLQFDSYLTDRFGALARKAFMEGGQLIWDKEWSKDFLIHYKINRQSIKGLRFPISVSLWSSDSSEPRAREEINVCLSRHGIPLGFDQIRGERMDGRQHQISPFWHHPDFPDKLQLFVTREMDIPSFGIALPPHRRLFDLSRLT